MSEETRTVAVEFALANRKGIRTEELIASAEKIHNFLVQSDPDQERLSHSEDTMLKVQEALLESGLTENQVIDAVSAMQNRGILFRERT